MIIEIKGLSGCDQEAGRLLGLKKESTRQLNNYLDVLQGKVYEAQRELVSNGLEVSAEKIRDFLLGREDSKNHLSGNATGQPQLSA